LRVDRKPEWVGIELEDHLQAVALHGWDAGKTKGRTKKPKKPKGTPWASYRENPFNAVLGASGVAGEGRFES